MTSSFAGLALRVTSSVEPASFYALKLQSGVSLNQYTFSKFVGGVETVLGSAQPNPCSVSSTAWVTFTFSITGNVLTASCPGGSLGSVTDTSGSPLYSGTAGLFHHPNPTIVSLTTATLVPVSTHARFRNVVISRGCDGPGSSCAASLPGEVCNMGCTAGIAAPVLASGLSVTCLANGAWSAPPLVCLPTVTSSGTYSVPAYSPVGTAVGLPLSSPPGFTVNFTITGSSPPGAPFTIGACSGLIQVSAAVLNFVTGPRQYLLNITASIPATGASYAVAGARVRGCARVVFSAWYRLPPVPCPLPQSTSA
jgi:hypothetical protein